MRALRVDEYSGVTKEVELPESRYARGADVNALLGSDCYTAGFTFDRPGGRYAITGYVDDNGMDNHPVGLAFRATVEDEIYENVWFGPVVILGLDNQTGDSVGLTPEMLAMIKIGPRTIERVQGAIVRVHLITLAT